MELEPRRLIAGLVLVFLLGIAFALVNGAYVEQSGSQLPLLVYGIAFLSVLLGASLVLLFQWRINRAQLSRVLSVLPREERLVVKTLLDNNNRLEQNRLVALTGLGKVKVSRVLKHLSERGVIEKHGLGNTNLVTLTL